MTFQLERLEIQSRPLPLNISRNAHVSCVCQERHVSQHALRSQILLKSRPPISSRVL